MLAAVRVFPRRRGHHTAWVELSMYTGDIRLAVCCSDGKCYHLPLKREDLAAMARLFNEAEKNLAARPAAFTPQVLA